jgi:CheY-like chemotaxis protein
VLVDIELPVMNGLELAAEARRRRPELGILFVTGYARPERLGALGPGDICLLKPYGSIDLANALQQLVKATPASSGDPSEPATAGRPAAAPATTDGPILTER